MREKAKEFAKKVHKDCRYGKDKPYSYHLEKVVGVLARFGRDTEELVCAAWLHDAVEDTPTTKEDVEEVCGPEVADLVWRVTKEPGKNRKESNKKTWPKLAASDDAVTLKLADRIANVEESSANSKRLFSMYSREYASFRDALHRDGHAEDMWSHLDSLLDH